MDELGKITANLPRYRFQQIVSAWFETSIRSFDSISTLPQNLREQLKTVDFMTVFPTGIKEDKGDLTFKTLLTLKDGATVETVLMGRVNKKITGRPGEVRYTICVSSQVGCPMKCTFCATGRLGLKRNLTWREILDQYRFWNYFIADHLEGKIDNIVFMGQGEPMLNYENVKLTINAILKNTELGPRQITVSTVGVKAGMEKIVTDPDWPAVRFALSLHSAITETRQKLVPSHAPGFLEWLPEWAKLYHERFSARTKFVGIEYTFIKDANDDDKHLKALVKLASKLGKTRINLIPYNSTDPNMLGSAMEVIEHWREELMKKDFTVTIRRSQGQRIAAACGQLSNKVAND
ncbi:MAG: hypothetical protein A3J93_02120 [Candidatus Magasanikbacteria bacterium RIFOXYC2_FULL_42_28]|uniref:Radical SAM core domain-containing protein n=1 Tax=Candidatus Magasanikbacteria bacterium RIFOXYC2_FULL_42_28 TaxID=1798704 RepID=A0A1F6NXB6_9BACT|nr:MAG: hypothetical protein A3J93_02120 [Candidatus Magasanikbacteria bacterium RIFOXYC2_FULL_42_28]